jgi:hypothetical protein
MTQQAPLFSKPFRTDLRKSVSVFASSTFLIIGLIGCNVAPTPVVDYENMLISEGVVPGSEKVISTTELHVKSDTRPYRVDPTFSLDDGSIIHLAANNGDLRWVFSHSWDKTFTTSSQVKQDRTLTISTSGSFNVSFDAELGVYKAVKVTVGGSITVSGSWTYNYSSCRTKNTKQTFRHDRYYQEKYSSASQVWNRTGGYSDSNKRMINQEWEWVPGSGWSPC